MQDQVIVGEEEILIKPLYLVLMKNQIGNIKQCKTLIRHQQVYVNNQIMDNVDYLVQPNDTIEIDHHIINTQPFVYIMMNKPKGYICANHDMNHPCVLDLIEHKDCFCLGRLDKDTTGLLLLSNDSSLSKKLLMPKHHVEKTYLVTTKYMIQSSLKKCFSEGIIIDQNIRCLPAVLEIIDDYHCFVTLHEGKYHQIKKMFLSCRNEVFALKRISFAGIHLDDQLKEGQYRYLNDEEFQKLK